MRALGGAFGSTLRLGRFCAGSFNPRNDGPLITGDSDAGAAARGPVAVGEAGTVPADTGPPEPPAVEGRAAVTGAAAAVACSKLAPHIPQKRFVSGFSFPQRLQRTIPPAYSLRYLAVRCAANRTRVSAK